PFLTRLSLSIFLLHTSLSSHVRLRPSSCGGDHPHLVATLSPPPDSTGGEAASYPSDGGYALPSATYSAPSTRSGGREVATGVAPSAPRHRPILCVLSVWSSWIKCSFYELNVLWNLVG
ncbi:Os12g0412400, partial [Oryza sativa Japonica Group]